MDEWLKQNWFFAGSTILCGIGLAFGVGARAEPKLVAAKNLWITWWAGLLGYYLFSIVLPALRIGNIFTSGIPAIFNGAATAAIAALWLIFRDQQLRAVDKWCATRLSQQHRFSPLPEMTLPLTA